MTQQQILQPHIGKWAWTLASGLFTIVLAVVAFYLPVIDWMPRGGLVGWLLFLAGMAELTFGWKRGLDVAGKAAVGAGLVTAAAGVLFIANPTAAYFPVANLVMAWLLLRGAWLLVMAFSGRAGRRVGAWLALSGAADVLLGVSLLAGLPIATAVNALFGPTREIVAQFALILAASFLVTGVSQVAIASLQRARSRAAD